MHAMGGLEVCRPPKALASLGRRTPTRAGVALKIERPRLARSYASRGGTVRTEACWKCIQESRRGPRDDRASPGGPIRLNLHRGSLAAASGSDRTPGGDPPSGEDNVTEMTSIGSRDVENSEKESNNAANADETGSKGSKEDEEEEYSMSVQLALAALRFYKQEISPLLPPSCRFIPSCSSYSMEAFKEFGTAKGFVLTAWRLLRCQPLGGKAGYDPPKWPPPGLERIFSS